MESGQDNLNGDLNKAPKGKQNKIQLSRQQIIFLFIVLMIFAVLLGVCINSMTSKKSELSGNSNTFETEGIVFERKKEDTAINKGDLIIFERDNAIDGYLIKRVIGVGRDTVYIDDYGSVYVNGEKYQTENTYYRKDVALPLTVPEGQLFVLGDSGDGSADSRNSYVGFVDAATVQGVAKE